MIRLIARRLASAIPLLFIVSVIIWGLVILVPGDPALAIAGESATPQQVEVIRRELGLNDPAIVRYGRWVGRAVRLDLGTSLFNSYPVTTAIRTRLPVTLSLTAFGFVFAMITGISLGVAAAVWKGTIIDRVLSLVSAVGVAIPGFWLGLILITFWGERMRLLPAGGYVEFTRDPAGWFRCLIMPGITLGAAASAEIARQMRASMIGVLEQDFVRTHRAKGLRPWTIIGKHALKNALLPVVTVGGFQLAALFGLTAIVEQIFNMPGVGQLSVESVFKRDVPVIQGIVLMITLIVLAANLLVDVSYGLLNPKVRTS